MRCWSFYRRSTERQELSIDDQRKACQRLALEHGWEIVREFVPPRGYASGLSIEQDPAFQQMVQLAEQGGAGVSALLIYDVSRLGRLPPKRKFYWEEHFRRHGIAVTYAAEPFQNDGSLGDEIHQFVSHSEAHQYSVRLSKSTIRGAKSHAALGRSCGGRPPLGYARQLVDSSGRQLGLLQHGAHKADKTQHVVWAIGPAAEVAIVREIFEAYARGAGLGAVRDELNRRGAPAPRGGAWAKNTIQAILKNPAYVGRRVYFKHAYHDRTGAAKRIRPAADWTVTENAHPALIELELWERVQARFKTRRAGDGRHLDSPYLLSGLIRCARCRHRYYGQMKRGQPYYLCGGFHSKGAAFCASYSVQAGALEDVVLEQVQRQVDQLLEAGTLALRFQELLEAQAAAAPAADVGAELAATDRQIRNLVDAIKAAGSSPVLLEELRRLEAARGELQRRAAISPIDAGAEGQLEQLLAEARDVRGLLASATAAERKELLREFVGAIEISPEAAEARLALHRIPFLAKKNADPMGAGVLHRDRCGGPIWPLWPAHLYDSVAVPLLSRSLPC